MKWGRRWGNQWGNDSVSPIRILDLREIPPAALVSWDEVPGDPLYHVYADGKFHAVTHGLSFAVQFRDFGRHWADVMISGPGNMDEDVSGFVPEIPGTRAKLSWAESSASDIDHYEIFWDRGNGSPMAYLGRTRGTELSWISDQLEDGSYVFRVDAVDSAGNRTQSPTKAVIILRYPDPPSDLEMTDYDESSQEGSFSFQESATASVIGYRAYTNSGSGAIDYGTPAETIAAGSTSFSLGMGTPGEWKVGLRAYNSSYEEDNVDVYVSFELGGSPLDLLDLRPNAPLALSAAPAAGGTFRLSCTYHAYYEKAKATGIRFYADDGNGGDIDYSSPVASADVSAHETGEAFFEEISATTFALTNGNEYVFVARAVTTSGRESLDSLEASGTADATAPAWTPALISEEVRYELE